MTITEIARKAGVSIGTVDRVIHNRGNVSANTKKIIEKILQESGYSPNPIAKRLKQNNPFLIGVLIPTLDSESGYWKMIYEGIVKAIKELEPFSMSIVCSEFDRLKNKSFTDSAKKLLAKNVDALLIAPVNQKESIELLKNIDIPYVFVDSPLPNTNSLMSVAQNPFKSGYCAARIMSLLCPDAKRLLTLQMHSNTYNLTQRAMGFESFYSDAKKDVIVDSIVLSEDASSNESEKALFDSIFCRKKDFDGIFVTNDSVYRIADYLLKTSFNKHISLIGYDLVEKNCLLLKEGIIDCLISQSPEIQGYDAVYSIYRKMILLQDPENIVAVPILTFFKESI